jgi:hypothetical protein
MSAAARARRPRAPPFVDPFGYGRHRPEVTLLYRLVQQHYPAFRELRFHMLFLDGVYLADGAHPPALRQVSVPDAIELQERVEQIATGVGQALERRGLIELDIENAWLSTPAEPGPLDDLIGHFIT